MIFEFITVFVLLFIILGLVFQFMPDIFVWVMFVSLVYYVAYVIVKIVFHVRRKKSAIKEQMSAKQPVPTEEAYQPQPAQPAAQPVQAQTVQQAQPVKQATQTAKPGQGTDIERLVAFINKNKKAGYKADLIKQALLKQGWPKTKVEQAFAVSK